MDEPVDKPRGQFGTPLKAALFLWIPVLLAIPTGWPKMETLWTGLAFNAAGLVLCFAYGRWRRPNRPWGGFRWFVAWVVVSHCGVWTADTRSRPHQEAILGGWVSGHGGFIPAWNGAITNDYSLMSSPTRVHGVALSPNGALAATVGDRQLRIWDVTSAETLCTEDLGWNDRVENVWIGTTLFELRFHRDGGRNKPLQLRRYPLAGIEDGRCRVGKPVELPPVLAECATADSLYVAQFQETRVVVRAIQRDVAKVASESGGFDVDAPPIVTVEGIRLNQARWRFAPGCRWLMWHTQRPTGENPKSGTQILAHRISVTPGSRPEPISTFVDHPHFESIRALQLSRDGRYLVALCDKSLTAYDTLEHQSKVITGQMGPKYAGSNAEALQIGPGGEYIVMSARSTGINAEPGVILVLEPGTLETRFRLEGHGDEIVSAALSANGAQLITGSRDQTARVWRLPQFGAETREGEN